MPCARVPMYPCARAMLVLFRIEQVHYHSPTLALASFTELVPRKIPRRDLFSTLALDTNLTMHIIHMLPKFASPLEHLATTIARILPSTTTWPLLSRGCKVQRLCWCWHGFKHHLCQIDNLREPACQVKFATVRGEQAKEHLLFCTTACKDPNDFNMLAAKIATKRWRMDVRPEGFEPGPKIGLSYPDLAPTTVGKRNDVDHGVLRGGSLSQLW